MGSGGSGSRSNAPEPFGPDGGTIPARFTEARRWAAMISRMDEPARVLIMTLAAGITVTARCWRDRVKSGGGVPNV